tara:strand:+ start:106 stop:273 length:168 start_codon:yes stop_codon:yes gene_type:complete
MQEKLQKIIEEGVKDVMTEVNPFTGEAHTEAEARSITYENIDDLVKYLMSDVSRG